MFSPFHAAEQRSKKKQKNDSAERSDFPRSLLFVSSTGQSCSSGPSDGLHFFVHFCQHTKLLTINGASKNEQYLMNSI